MNKQVASSIEINDAELNDIKTISDKIRYLNAAGMTRSQIAKKLDKRYQHVRNVLTTELKKK